MEGLPSRVAWTLEVERSRGDRCESRLSSDYAGPRPGCGRAGAARGVWRDSHSVPAGAECASSRGVRL